MMPAAQRRPGGSPAPVATEEHTPARRCPADPVAKGGAYGTGGCDCSASGAYGARYGTCGPDVAGCMDDCGDNNIWFGGVFYLFMDRATTSSSAWPSR